MIAFGGNERKVHLINNEHGRSVGPNISGHAGSVRCVAINEKKGYILSGSYDTSIRWVVSMICELNKVCIATCINMC